MNPERQKADELESKIEKAVSDKDIETMRELLPEYEKLVLRLSGKHFEQIENFNLTEQLERFKSFYEDHEIETPEDFEEQITDIWNRNAEEIGEVIKEGLFDEILFIPPYDTKDINDKTKSEYNETWQSINFKEGGSFEGVQDTRTGTRIILFKGEILSNLEHSRTINKTLYDLCNANTDAEKAKIDELVEKKLPLPIEGFTLGEYLIADRIYFKENDNHLDSGRYTRLTATYSGERVADSSWDPVDSQMDVDADGAGVRASILGARSSRVFN